MECRFTYLRPGQIVQRLKECPVVYIPFGPLEWHGPHLPYGMDPLNAEHCALESCRNTGGIVWPTQYWGTERERTPAQLKSLGFREDEYVVGMDFPKHSLPSMYCPEEVFAVIVRELLRESITLGAKVAVLVNGHGAENHMAVFKRLTCEFNNTTKLRVHFRVAAPRMELAGSGEHAGRMETAILMHLNPTCVDLQQLPPKNQPLRYADFGIVDGPGFDGRGGKGNAVGEAEDPRLHSTPEMGKDLIERTVQEIAAEVRGILKEL